MTNYLILSACVLLQSFAPSCSTNQKPSPDKYSVDPKTAQQLRATENRKGRLAIIETFRRDPRNSKHHPYIPLLRKLLVSDPDAKVREAIAEPLAYMVFANPPRLCPLGS